MSFDTPILPHKKWFFNKNVGLSWQYNNYDVKMYLSEKVDNVERGGNLWMNKRHLEVPQKIWKDKRISKETKYIYSYIYTKGFDRIITDINIGEIQQTIKIKNKGLKKCLDILKELKYLVYQEYDTGMYTINLLGC